MKLSLKKKLSIFTIIAIGGVFCIFLAISLSFIKRSFLNSNELLLKEETQKAAQEINKQLSTHMGVARGLARSFESSYNYRWEEIHPLLNTSIKQVTSDEKDYLATWHCFEYRHINSQWGDKPGRLTSTWLRENGQLKHKEIERDMNGDRSSVFYSIIDDLNETVVEPYWYPYGEAGHEKILETSIIVPMQNNGKGVGVVGIDMSLDAFPAYVSHIKPFKTSETYLLSTKGTIIGYTDTNTLGEPINNFYSSVNIDSYQQMAVDSCSIIELKKDGAKYIVTLAPIYIGKSTSPWFIMISTPKSALTAEANWIVIIMLIIGLSAIVLIAILVYMLVGKITKPIVLSTHITSTISAGDLTSDMCYKKEKDELDILNNSLYDMQEKLSNVVKLIRVNSHQIQKTSDKLELDSNSLTTASSSMASSSEEVSSAIEEMTANIEQNSQNAQLTSQISHTALESVKSSNTSTQRMREAMGSVAERISIIQDIASQTNILSLNAAVEAARAGNSGRGFSVVATEVKKLAERSQSAAADIEKLSRRALMISEKAGNDMEELVPEIEKTSSLVDEITAASMEQNMGIQQISGALQHLNDGTQQNASLADTLAQSADELSNFATELQNQVAYFKITRN